MSVFVTEQAKRVKPIVLLEISMVRASSLEARL